MKKCIFQVFFFKIVFSQIFQRKISAYRLALVGRAASTIGLKFWLKFCSLTITRMFWMEFIDIWNINRDICEVLHNAIVACIVQIIFPWIRLVLVKVLFFDNDSDVFKWNWYLEHLFNRYICKVLQNARITYNSVVLIVEIISP